MRVDKEEAESRKEGIGQGLMWWNVHTISFNKENDVKFVTNRKKTHLPPCL